MGKVAGPELEGTIVESAAQCIHILYVEDNAADTALVHEAFLEYGHISSQLHSVHDGEAALAFLQQQGFYAGMPRPHLIILDIGLPRMSGWDVLIAIRARPSLAMIPVVMLTGIMNVVDTEHREALQPSACLIKPMNLTEYRSLVATLVKLVGSESPH
jgi:two-component system response regulator